MAIQCEESPIYCILPPTSYLLRVPPTSNLLLRPIAYHLPPTTFHLPPTTIYHLPPPTYHLPPTTYYLLYYLLPRTISTYLSHVTSRRPGEPPMPQTLTIRSEESPMPQTETLRVTHAADAAGACLLAYPRAQYLLVSHLIAHSLTYPLAHVLTYLGRRSRPCRRRSRSCWRGSRACRSPVSDQR